jgi:hypothetical protein
VHRLGALVILLALTACGSGSYQREIEVRFTPGPGSGRPDPAQVAAVRAACPGTATVILRPPSTSTTLVAALTPIHYDARKADDRQVEVVQSCVRAMPGVASVSLVRQDY